jgi:hypothetical protein
MKISNFRLIEKSGNSVLNYCFKATVTIETGIFFKSKRDVEVFKPFACHWRFVDTGKFTPDLLVERLEMSYLAKLMLSDISEVIL